MIYKYDIFISCPDKADPNISKWIEDFSAILKNLTSKFLKRDCKIITSKQIKNDKEFSNVAPIDIFKDTGTFISIINNEEKKTSNSSAQELATILSVLQKDHNADGNSNRLFKVLINHVQKADQPEFLRTIIPYIFFKENENGNEQIDLADLTNYAGTREYRLRFIDLTYNIVNYLRQTSIKKDKTIYLAETGADQYANREAIKRELIHYGYTILPDKTLPHDKEKFEKYVNECLKFSEYAIHIIGSDEGNEVSNSSLKSLGYQNILASSFYKENPGKITRLIWIPPDLIYDDEDQQINIEKLKRGKDELAGAELIQTPIEEFKSLLHRNFSKLKHAEKTPSTHLNKKNIYLVHHNNYLDRIKPVIDYLYSQNLDITYIDYSQEDSSLINQHRKNLHNCDAVMICSDNRLDEWLRSKQNDIVKSMGFGRNRPFLSKAIFMVNPLENKIEDHDYLVIDGSAKDMSIALKPFIEKLN